MKTRMRTSAAPQCARVLRTVAKRKCQLRSAVKRLKAKLFWKRMKRLKTSTKIWNRPNSIDSSPKTRREKKPSHRISAFCCLERYFVLRRRIRSVKKQNLPRSVDSILETIRNRLSRIKMQLTPCSKKTSPS